MIPKHCLQLVEAIEATGKRLLPKDQSFLTSVTGQAKTGRRLTEKQAKYLQDIYAKTHGGGDYVTRERIG